MLQRAFVTCVAALLGCCLLVAPAQAQFHIDFGVGHGHHGHHHRGWHDHGHWHGYGWYPNYWYNPPVEYVYVAPPPPRVISYVAPTPTPQQAQTAPTPNNAAPRSATRTNSLPSGGSKSVTIRNPVASGGSVVFVIDGQNEWELEPGEAKSLNDKAAYQVEFDRGEDFGAAQREVSAGLYEFVVTDSGWELKRQDSSTWRSALAPTVRKNSLPGTRR